MPCPYPGASAPEIAALATALRLRGLDSPDLDELVAGVVMARQPDANDDAAIETAAAFADVVNDGGLEQQIGYLFGVHEGRGDDVRIALSNFLALPLLIQ